VRKVPRRHLLRRHSSEKYWIFSLYGEGRLINRPESAWFGEYYPSSHRWFLCEVGFVVSLFAVDQVRSIGILWSSWDWRHFSKGASLCKYCFNCLSSLWFSQNSLGILHHSRELNQGHEEDKQRDKYILLRSYHGWYVCSLRYHWYCLRVYIIIAFYPVFVDSLLHESLFSTVITRCYPDVNRFHLRPTRLSCFRRLPYS